MGFFSKIGKGISDFIDGTTNAIGDGAEFVGDKIQEVGNFAIDGVQSIARQTVEKGQDMVNDVFDLGQDAFGFVGNVATGAIDGIGNGIEASVGDNIVSNSLHSLTQGARTAGSKVDEVVEKGQDMINNGLDKGQEIDNEISDTIQDGMNSIIDGGQSIVKNTYNVVQDIATGAVDIGTGVVGAVGDGAIDGVESAAHGAAEAVKPITDTIGKGIDFVGDKIQDAGGVVKDGIENVEKSIKGATKAIQEDTNTIGGALGETNVGKGVSNICNFVQEQFGKGVNAIEDLFKNDNGIENESSISSGIKMLSSAVANLQSSVEVGLKNGQSLLFNAICGNKAGADIFSSKDLANPLATTDKGGNVTSGSMDSVLDEYSEGNGLTRSSLSITNDKSENTLSDTLSAFINLSNPQQSL